MKTTTKRKRKAIGAIASRSSDVSGYEVFAIDGEDDEARLATVFLRRATARKKAEYAVFVTGSDEVDPAAGGHLATSVEPWDDAERERLVRAAIEESDLDLPIVARDIAFLWDVEADADEDLDDNEDDDDDDSDDEDANDDDEGDDDREEV